MTTPRRSRLVLVPGGRDEPFRRYRLARLDEVALASPHGHANGNGHRPEPEAGGAGGGAVRDRRVPR